MAHPRLGQVCPATAVRHWDGSWRLADMHLARAIGDDVAGAMLPPARRLQYCPPELLRLAPELETLESSDGSNPVLQLCGPMIDIFQFGCTVVREPHNIAYIPTRWP